MSDILLLARYDTLVQGRRITPFILSNAGLLSDTLSFFTVISSQRPSRDSIFFNVLKLEGKERIPSSYGRSSLSGIGPSFDPCRMGVDTILVYSYPINVVLARGFSYIFGGVPKPLPGNYLLEVLAETRMGPSLCRPPVSNKGEVFSGYYSRFAGYGEFARLHRIQERNATDNRSENRFGCKGEPAQVLVRQRRILKDGGLLSAGKPGE